MTGNSTCCVLLLVAMSAGAAALAQPLAAPQRPRGPDSGNASATPQVPSVFFDYDLAYAQRAGQPGTLAAVTSHGIRIGRLLLFNELASWESGGDGALMRGDSGLMLDLDAGRTRLIAGDMSSRSAGSLGDHSRLLGIGVQSGGHAAAAPASAPFRAFTRETGAGGTLDVYVDGLHLQHAEVRPGRSPLRGIARFAGLRTVEVVTRDAAGREVRTVRNGYRADRMLAAGASEFEYMLGRARLDEDEYGDTAFVLSHRAGVTDRVTLGGLFEGVGRHLAGTLGLGARLEGLGLISGEVGVSRDDDAPVALSGALRYSHSYRGLNLTLGYLRADADYRSSADADWSGTAGDLVEDMGAKLSYALPMLGTFTLTGTRSAYDGAAPQTLTSLTYSYANAGRWRVDWTLAYRARSPSIPDPRGWMAGLNLTIALDAPARAAGSTPFSWMERARRALGSGFGEAYEVGTDDPARAGHALASARRFETAAGTLYGNVDTGDALSAAPASWRLGWSGSLVGVNGVWAPRGAGRGI